MERIQPVLWKWLWRVMLDWSIVLGCFILCGAFWFAWPICIPLLATRQHALGILGHDGAHRLACSNKFWNDVLTSLLCLGPLGIPLGGYRHFHFGHHRHVGTDKDPERIHKRLFPQWEPPLHYRTLTRQILVDLLGGGIPHIAMAIWLTRPRSLRDAWLCPLISLTFLAICWYSNTLWIPILWFGTQITAFWAVFRLRLWSEHAGTNSTYRIKADWWQRLLFLPHSTWYHWEHHYNPNIPCWSLYHVRNNPNAPYLPQVPIQTVNQLFHHLTIKEPVK
jgi:fatty acid desaturase